MRKQVNGTLCVGFVMCLAACGDNISPCNYVEAADPTNGDTAEPTGLVIADQPEDVCGHIDTSDYDTQLSTVDVDTFRVSVTATGPMLVQLVADAGAELLGSFTVRIFDTATNPTLLAEGAYDTKLAAHGAFLTSLTPGDYDVVVAATASGGISSALGYRVQLTPLPTDPCPRLDDTPFYSEANDGADNTGNDTTAVDYTKNPQFTPLAGSPEATNLSVTAGLAYRITGSSAIVTHSDEYLDRDTFELSTADDSNELTVRLEWDSTTADLDYLVFEKATLALAAAGNTASTSLHELETFAVKPSTTYWLWIGGFKGSTGVTPYDVAICGGHFFN